jgi:hypothetical protein
MAIVFHCEHCAKKIEAPDKAGGKQGKCPACHNRVYVPAPLQEDDDLHLAPIDESEESKRQKMMAETFNLTEQLLNEKTAPDIPSEEIPAPEGGLGIIPLPGMDDKSLIKSIVNYLQCMAEGQLDRAAELGENLIAQGKRVNPILDQIALNQITDPRLAKIPPQVLAGLIRSLRGQLES